jgi:DNA adenine methylase
MKAPFPWFGGKRRVADVVWSAFGDVDNYVEPFAGGLAVLLERPESHERIATGAETVNDADLYLANLWRAIVANPEAVAQAADWPVNETDLFARHLWLVNEGKARLSCMEGDPDFCDAKVAGWWLWGVCAWIGLGWCSGTGPWRVGEDGRPHLGDAGQGVNRKRPHLGDAGEWGA